MKQWLDIILRIIVVVVLVTLLTGAAFLAGFGTGALYEAAAAGRAQAALQPPPAALPTEAPPPATEPSSPPGEPTPAPPTDAAPAPTPPEPPEGPQPLTPEERAAFDIFWEAWRIVEQEYYGELPDEKEVVYGAIRGALQTLNDDYTSFIEPGISAILREDATGAFEGIGALVRMNEQNRLEIVRPFEGQPAAKAGLLPGDVVVAVDGVSIIGKGIYEAIGLIRGPEGTQVTLTIVRPGREDRFDVEITRARIEIPIVEARMIGDDIAYISLADFSGQATQQLKAALSELLQSGAPQGLILDLRDNPGGFLREAVNVADQFLPEGVILIERSSDGRTQTYRSTDDGLAEDIPLVVLVNAGSASASEIVAGAIQDRGRGQLVGETTFGKGSVQLPHELSDGSELRVTIAHWFTPSGRAIHGVGLEPDVPVERTPEDVTNGVDPQLDRAIELLRQGS